MRKKRSKKFVQANDTHAKSTYRKKLIGYDWGYPSFSMVAANTELITRLGAGGFSGCSYGLMSRDGPPYLSLVGTNLSAMKSALNLIREWVAAAGPNVISLEILFDGEGYAVAISQQHDLLRWRLFGIDTAENPIVLTVSLTKRMNTRHPFLNELADYAQRPISPVFLTVAAVPGLSNFRKYGAADIDTWFEGAIKLPGINVYRSLAERPAGSMIRLETESVDKGLPPSPDVKPDKVNRNRESRLTSTFAKTIHALRHSVDGGRLLSTLKELGYADWQAEQAICNTIINNAIPDDVGNAIKRQKFFDELRRSYIEQFSVKIDLSLFSIEQIRDQIKADAQYLLTKVAKKANLGDDFRSCYAQLKELGYV